MTITKYKLHNCTESLPKIKLGVSILKQNLGPRKSRTDTQELSGLKLEVPSALPMPGDFLVSCFYLVVVEGP